MRSEMASLLLRDISFSYGNNGFALKDVALAVKPGEMVALLGPNGCGKTTLLRLASGVLSPARGEVLVQDVPLRRLSRRQVAQRIAVVPQQFTLPFAFTVAEVVLLGRTPFLRTLAGETEQDRSAARQALAQVGIEALAKRHFNELSGGERQKVVLAMALAQGPRVLLLDEPTAHLDINHQVEILELVHRLNRERGVTVVAAMHDLNLAALYFERLVLMRQGGIHIEGPSSEVLTEGTIEQVFAARVQVSRHPSTQAPQVTLLPRDGLPQG